METDYQKQANDFLMETGTEFKAEFLRHGKHFDDDKETRDIYQITLTREKRSYSFNFGQSINNSEYLIKNVNTGRITHQVKRDKVTVTRKETFSLRMAVGRVLGFPLQSCDELIEPSAPTAYDVLACITKSDPGTFENFCGEFGYNTDSIKAEKTYRAVMDEWQNIKALWLDSEIERLQEIN
jgi:hypothetical protein